MKVTRWQHGGRVSGFLTVLACALIVTIANAQAGGDAQRCPGEVFALSAKSATPVVALGLDGEQAPFLLDYGSTGSVEFTADTPRAAVRHAAFSLPSFSEGRFALVARRATSLRGVVGTDFLSLLTADFDFSDGVADVVLSGEPCPVQALRRRRLTPIPQRGFFSSDAQSVAQTRPNVPVLPLRIGGVETWAQIDSGYDDAVAPPSIDINQALFDRLIAAGVALEPRKSITVATCDGTETRRAYAVANAVVVDGSGAEIITLNDATLLVKQPNGCGGIADLTEPAAQLGVSALRAIGEVVFDPKRELVWIGAARHAGADAARQD